MEAKRDQGRLGSARYLFAGLRPFFKWCAEHDICPVSPLQGAIPPKPLEERDRVLNDAEIKSFCNAPIPIRSLVRSIACFSDSAATRRSL